MSDHRVKGVNTEGLHLLVELDRRSLYLAESTQREFVHRRMLIAKRYRSSGKASIAYAAAMSFGVGAALVAGLPWTPVIFGVIAVGSAIFAEYNFREARREEAYTRGYVTDSEIEQATIRARIEECEREIEHRSRYFSVN